MACRPSEKAYGYESCRFEKDVDEHFHCSICYNVLKEPRMCRNNEHMFCLACITEHLTVNSQSCPECNEHLSVDTLRRPRVVNNILSKLKIKCDYASRGCSEFVCVEELQSHVDNCGFSPVTCANEECGMVIDRQDKVHHETEVCEYRKVKCHDCEQIKNVVGRLEGSSMELDGKVRAVTEGNKKIDEKVDTCTRELKELKESLNEMKQEVKEAVKHMEEIILKVSKDVDEVKAMMIEILEKLDRRELLDKLPSSTGGMMTTPREDILIAGGSLGKSTEIYSWEKNGWLEVSDMITEHKGASSFIYKDQVFVVGGENNKTIETADLHELPLKWIRFPRELPYPCDDHQTIVYQKRIVHIGGYNYCKRKQSNMISELHLSSPCIMKGLHQMPEPRDRHGVEIFEDKILIIGGVKSFPSFLDSVLKFDVTKNEHTEMPPLPGALYNMATVRCKDKAVVLGGQDEDKKCLNDVFMYDCKTGKITTLPSMLEKRSRCCAVITGNTIVVMGGCDDDRKDLKSVECFTMGGSSWKYLPDMNKARCGAVAEVLPSTRKYV